MATKIIMPQLGESVVEGTVAEWLKREGEHVEAFEPIVRVSTDKVDSEIPSPAAGTLLKIYVQEDETVNAGVVLAIIGEPNEIITEEDGSTAVGNGHHAPPEPKPISATTPTSGYSGHVTPVVARMASEHKLDLSRIQGTGRGGRITKKDVEAYLSTQSVAPTKTDVPPWEQPVSGELFKPTVEYELDEPPATKPTTTPHPAPTPKDIPGELVKLSAMRRTIAKHMVESKLHTSPHVTTVFEADMSAVLAHRDKQRAEYDKAGVKLTLTPYFVAAAVTALREHPYINSQWTDGGIFLHRAAHIGIAVALDDGLIVPVIRNAQDYNLMGLARQVNDLSERARSGALRPDEVGGGTFTITNHGVTGSLFATPIINQPQAAILGVGVVEKRVKVVNDAIAIRPCVYLSLTFDHRLIDGATADNFMARLKNLLESWQ